MWCRNQNLMIAGTHLIDSDKGLATYHICPLYTHSTVIFNILEQHHGYKCRTQYLTEVNHLYYALAPRTPTISWWSPRCTREVCRVLPIQTAVVTPARVRLVSLWKNTSSLSPSGLLLTAFDGNCDGFQRWVVTPAAKDVRFWRQWLLMAANAVIVGNKRAHVGGAASSGTLTSPRPPLPLSLFLSGENAWCWCLD